MRSVESTVKARKLQSVMSLPSEVTDDAVKDHCITEISDHQPQQNTELEASTTVSRKITANKSRLSEMDSGIQMEEVKDDDSAVGPTAHKKVSSQDASVRQELSATRPKLSRTQTECNSGSSAHSSGMKGSRGTSLRKCMTVGNDSGVDNVVEKSFDGSSSRIPMTLTSPTATIHSKLRNFTTGFDDTDGKELPVAELQSESSTRQMKLQKTKKKLARNEVVDTQPKCVPVISKCDIDISSEAENDGKCMDKVDPFVIDSSDADEPTSASIPLAPSISHTDTGIVVITEVYDFLVL